MDEGTWQRLVGLEVISHDRGRTQSTSTKVVLCQYANRLTQRSSEEHSCTLIYSTRKSEREKERKLRFNGSEIVPISKLLLPSL